MRVRSGEAGKGGTGWGTETAATGHPSQREEQGESGATLDPQQRNY